MIPPFRSCSLLTAYCSLAHRSPVFGMSPLLALLAIAACASRNPAAPAPRPPNTTGDPSRTYALDQVYLLEVAGVPPDDTTLSVSRGQRRVIVLRHGPPDNLIFAEVTLPAEGLDSAASDAVRLE